jgi:hypothetical protein
VAWVAMFHYKLEPVELLATVARSRFAVDTAALQRPVVQLQLNLLMQHVLQKVVRFP